MHKQPDSNNAHAPIIPVILAGGSGSRLWPLSRKQRPKPFIRFCNKASFFQRTLLRVTPFQPPVVCCNRANYELAAQQAAETGQIPQQMFLEPAGRGTAAAAAVVAHYFAARGQGNVNLLLLPADHLIREPAIFYKTATEATKHAQAGNFVLTGIKAEKADPGFGYILLGSDADGSALDVERFVEKPRRREAAAFLTEGHWLWNSGIYMFTPSLFLSVLKQLDLSFYELTYQAVARAQRRQNAVLLNEEALTSCPSASFDRLVVQKAQNRKAIKADMGWQDIGSWPALIRNFRNICKG